MFRLVLVTLQTQFKLSVRDWGVLTPVLAMPLQVLPALAIFIASNRADLASYALTAALLFSIGQMCFAVSSEIVSNDRSHQRLELLVATPASYPVILASRAFVVSFLGLAGFFEAWLLAKLVFDISIEVHHPATLAFALLATAFAGAGTAVLTAALFSLARQTRTIQNAVYGPFYLMSGVLVPIAFLPAWLQVLSPLFFFYWSAEIVRLSFAAAEPVDAVFQVGMLILIGCVSAVLGAVTMNRMLDQLRQNGRLGLT
ncbi:hypothetical protein GCM10007205_06330 [Oxalicibacterium flavum]|uniref:ABC-2 type transporter transmembrane domain-containing protein n=1 Tax=Oxalicibacterium flavum TaxID=179467 RepID=A0A8J2XWT0_9BURK|nr:ABC transporter permease [Oxalicibacterium flavum]GGB99740.1 hypothetical protein GCM10007205_06330 [Oxalicibacterium flavum]